MAKHSSGHTTIRRLAFLRIRNHDALMANRRARVAADTYFRIMDDRHARRHDVGGHPDIVRHRLHVLSGFVSARSVENIAGAAQGGDSTARDYTRLSRSPSDEWSYVLLRHDRFLISVRDLVSVVVLFEVALIVVIEQSNLCIYRQSSLMVTQYVLPSPATGRHS